MMKLKRYLLIAISIMANIAEGQTLNLSPDPMSDPALRNALVSVSVLDAKNGQSLYSLNPELSLVPASTLKLLTTGAAAGILGSNFRFTTRLYLSGTFSKATGRLNGDVIIMGGGDPTLQSDQFAKQKVAEEWASALYAYGLREISGKIIGDASLWPRESPGAWLWEDVNNYYAAAPSGLNYYTNKFSLLFSTGAAGSAGTITAVTPAYSTRSLSIVNKVTAGGKDDQAYLFGDPYGFAKEVQGTLPPFKKDYRVDGVLPDPALLCAEQLADAMRKKGIKGGVAVSNYARKNYPAMGEPVITHRSPDLEQIIFHTNISSNNLFCEALLLQLGSGNRSLGISNVKTFWHTKGLDSSEVFMKDGCGLARANYCNTGFLAQLLHIVYSDSNLYRIINPSLPVAGRQGSMQQLGKGTALENNLRAKTGYVLKVRAYSGYLRSRSGRDLAFSVIINNFNCTAAETRVKIEKILLNVFEQL